MRKPFFAAALAALVLAGGVFAQGPTAGPGVGAGGSSSGNVVGPSSSTTNDCAQFADTTGKLLKDGSCGGVSSVFSGAVASAVAFSATPTFSLAAVSSQSPVYFNFGALTANVTSVTFTNKTAGALFLIRYLQDATGTRTVAYGASVSSATNCGVPDPGANVVSTQMFAVESDGATVDCLPFQANPAWRGISGPEVSSLPTAVAGQDFLAFDSSTHRILCSSNGSTLSACLTAISTDTLTGKTYDTAGSGNTFKINGTAVSAVTGTGSVVLATSPTLVTPALGTPASGVGTNLTGIPPAAVTSAQGNGTKFQLSTGTTTTNDCVKFDANGNTVDAGAGCGGSGGSSFVDYIAGAATITDIGSNVTLYSYAAPALAAGTCYELRFWLHNPGVATQPFIYAGSTKIATIWSSDASNTDGIWDIEYCNNAGVQNAQTVTYHGSYYGNGPPANFYPNGSTVEGPTVTPTGVDWSTGHTITIQSLAASGVETGIYLVIHAH
jgi:hypothetical protein